MKKLLIIGVRFYQLCISPFFLPCCKMTPTCSEYAIDVLKTHSFLRALYLIIKRFLSCNPFATQKFDPPPCCGTSLKNKD